MRQHQQGPNGQEAQKKHNIMTLHYEFDDCQDMEVTEWFDQMPISEEPQYEDAGFGEVYIEPQEGLSDECCFKNKLWRGFGKYRS